MFVARLSVLIDYTVRGKVGIRERMLSWTWWVWECWVLHWKPVILGGNCCKGDSAFWVLPGLFEISGLR